MVYGQSLDTFKILRKLILQYAVLQFKDGLCIHRSYT